MMRFSLLSLFIISLSFSSCVSKKKFQETLLDCSKKSQNYENRIDSIGKQLTEKGEEIRTLELLYSEQRGANEVLLITQDKLQDRLDEVQNKVLETQAAKSSSMQDFQAMVKEREEEIRQRDKKLADLKKVIAQQEKEQNTMMVDFTGKLSAYGDSNYTTRIINGELRISLSEVLFFYEDQARVKTEGVRNLAQIASLINAYPSINVYVIGNTDNQKAKKFADNLELSALRAVNVVRVLTDEYGVSPSRVMAVGKGEFAPIASNETVQGKEANRRMDFIVVSRMDRVIKDIDKILEKE